MPRCNLAAAAAAASAAQPAQDTVHRWALALAQQRSRPPALTLRSMLGTPAAGQPAGLEARQQRRASAGHSTVTDVASAHQHASVQDSAEVMQDSAHPGPELSTHTSQHQYPSLGSYEAALNEVPAHMLGMQEDLLASAGALAPMPAAAQPAGSTGAPAQAAGSTSASTSTSLFPMSPLRQMPLQRPALLVQPLQLAGVTAGLSQLRSSRHAGQAMPRARRSARPQGAIPEPLRGQADAAGASSTAPAASSLAALDAGFLDSRAISALRSQYNLFAMPLELLAAHEQQIVLGLASTNPLTYPSDQWLHRMHNRLEFSLAACRQAIALLQQHEQPSVAAASSGITAVAAASAAVDQPGGEAGPSSYRDGSNGGHLQDSSTQAAVLTSGPSSASSQAHSAGSSAGQPGQLSNGQPAGPPVQAPAVQVLVAAGSMPAAQQVAARPAVAEAAEQQQQPGTPGAAARAGSTSSAGGVSRSVLPTADLVALMAR